jgi:hypothetical protein
MYFCASLFCAGAQKTLSFSSQNYVGLLEGDIGSALNLQSINGFNYKNWFSGIGVGIDYYRIRSVPLFLSINRNIEIRRNVFYITADGGWNLPWLTKNEETWNGSNFKEGVIAGTGVGYKILLNKSKQALLLNTGYSFKRLHEERDITSPCLVPPCPVDIEKTKYDFNRLLIRAGLEF